MIFILRINKKFKVFKIFICFLLIFTLGLSSYREQKASAFSPVAIAGAILSPEVAGALFVGTLAIGGYEVISNYSPDVKEYINNKVSQLGADALEKFLHMYNDSKGNTYAGLTSDGFSWMNSLISDFFNQSSIDHDTSSGVSSGTYKNVNYNSYTMGGAYTVYSQFSIPGHSAFDYLFCPGGSNISYYFKTYVNDDNVAKYFRFIQKQYEVDMEISTDGANWKYYTHVMSNNQTFVFGYNMTTGKSTVAPSQTVKSITPTTVAPSQTVSVPVSSTADSTGEGVYNVSSTFTGESASDYVHEGLVATVATPSTTTDTTTDTTASNTGVISTAVNGIKTFVGNLLDVVSQILDWLKGFVDNLISALKTLLSSIFGSLINTVARIWDWCGDLVNSILQGVKSIFQGLIDTVTSIYDWLSIDWSVVSTHINYIDIVKEHFKPFFDIVDLLSNIESNPQSSDGKFYMTIPTEMGGDGQEHCVLDLSIGSDYIHIGRDIIKYGIWIAFLWFVIKTFSPKFNIN